MYKFLFVVLVAATVSNVSALSDDEKNMITSTLVPAIKDCAEETGVSTEVIKQAKESHTLASLDPCLQACVFKKIGVLTDDGVVDVDQSLKTSSKFVSGADYGKVTEIVKNCASVNSEAVSDGSKGCDRARLLANCLEQYKGTL